MSFDVIKTNKAPAAIGPYSQAIRAGAWLFVSGQIGLHPTTGELVCDVFSEQASQALDNMYNILSAAGFEMKDVVSVDVFLTDITQFSAFNEVYGRYFSQHKPARAVVAVRDLPRGAQVEIKCIAVRTS